GTRVAASASLSANPCSTRCAAHARSTAPVPRAAMPRRPPAPGMSAASFDHLVGGGKQIERDGEPECPGRLEIYEQLVFGRQLNRQVGRLFTLEQSARVVACDTEQRVRCSSVTEQAPGLHEFAALEDRGQSMASRQGGNSIGVAEKQSISANN